MAPPKNPTPADIRNLTALAEMLTRWGTAKNEKIEDVPGYGTVVVQYRAIHRLGDLGLVTWKAHSQEVSVYQGFRFGRLGGTKLHIVSWVTAELTEAGRALLAAQKK